MRATARWWPLFALPVAVALIALVATLQSAETTDAAPPQQPTPLPAPSPGRAILSAPGALTGESRPRRPAVELPTPTATPGRLHLGAAVAEVPPDIYLTGTAAGSICGPRSCTAPMAYQLGHGLSTVFLNLSTGELSDEVARPGDQHAFDFFRTGIPLPTATANDPPPWIEGNDRFNQEDRAPSRWVAELNQRGISLDEIRTAPQLLADLMPSAWLDVDFNGDGAPEHVVGARSEGILDWVLALTGEAGHYYLVAQERGRFRFMPAELLGPVDLDQDGTPEVVAVMTDCGAHTCHTNASIFSWRDGRMRVDWGVQQRTARIWLEPEDGWTALAIHSGAINSVGAGPARTMLDRYRWTGRELIQIEHQLDPSPWLIHAIYDGLDAHAAGAYDIAIEHFQAAIADETLQTWRSYNTGRPDAADEEIRERRELRSFARFRLALALLARDRPDSTAARQILAEAERDDAESAYGPVSALFWQAMVETKSPSAACSRVQEYVGRHSPTLQVLNAFGYGNRELTATDVCPIAG